MYDPNSPDIQSDPEVNRLKNTERRLEDEVSHERSIGHFHHADITQQHLDNVDDKLHQREDTIEERTLADQSQGYGMGR